MFTKMSNTAQVPWTVDVFLLVLTVAQVPNGSTVSLPKMGHKQALINSGYRKLITLNVILCVQECLNRKLRCRSVNFYQRYNLCELCEQTRYTEPNNLQKKIGSVHIEMGDINQDLQTQCDTFQCLTPRTQKCIANASGTACIFTECEFPPTVGCAYRLSTLTNIGAIIKYSCREGTLLIGHPYVTCQNDGNWSNIAFSCQASNCSIVKACSSDYQDGEYWLYPSILKGARLRVYCERLQTSAPTEYITVNPNTNYAYGSAPDNRESCPAPDDISVPSLEDMSVNRSDLTHTYNITTGNITFFNKRISYGQGFTCFHSGCSIPRYAYSTVDTAGTGLLVNQTLEWKTGGWMTSIISFSRSNDNVTIHSECRGYCGWCEPVGDMNLVISVNEYLPDSGATFP